MVPFSTVGSVVNFSTTLLFVIAISGLGVLGVLCAGWSSNSKYAFLGAIRSSAQLISYEVSLGVIILTVVLVSKGGNLGEIVMHQNESVKDWNV